MPKYIFADGKVRVEEDKFAPLVTPKKQFTDSVVFLKLHEQATKQNVTSVPEKEDKDVHKDQ